MAGSQYKDKGIDMTDILHGLAVKVIGLILLGVLKKVFQYIWGWVKAFNDVISSDVEHKRRTNAQDYYRKPPSMPNDMS